MAKVAEPPAAKNDAENPFAMLKKKKAKVELTEEEAKAKKDKEDSQSEGSSQRKNKKKGKGSAGLKLKPESSKQDLELVDNGIIPVEFVKANNETVSLLKQTDEKLKRILEMYVPARKVSSLKSSTSSKKSKSSGKKIKPYKISTAYTVVPDELMPAKEDKKEDATSFKDYMNES